MIYQRKSRLPVKKQQKLLEHFVAGTTARAAALLVGVQANTAKLFYQRLRQLIASKQNSYALDGEVEVDESYFGGVRKGKRGRGAGGKVTVKAWRQSLQGYLLGRYWQERGQHTRSPETIGRAFKKLIPFFGDLLPSHVSNQLFRKFAEEHQGVSHGSIIRWLGILKAALRYAEGSRWIAPLPPFKMPVNHPPPRDLWLTREQVATLIANAKSPHIELFIKMAVFTGARSGAILDLTWDQVDMERRIINFGRGWGNKRRAIVPMNAAVHESLLTARELAQSDHVIEFNGKSLKSIKKAFERLCKSCNVKASPHVLRHTAATWLVMDGVPLREVARLLGNSEAMVEKVYGKHAPDYLRRAVNSLNLIKPNMPSP